jgi:hypothetical protein
MVTVLPVAGLKVYPAGARPAPPAGRQQANKCLLPTVDERPLSEAISDLPTRRQAPYTAWRRRQGQAAENHPATFADLVSTVTAFADPLSTGAALGRAWDPATRAWQTT